MAVYLAVYAVLSTGGVLLLRTALKDVDGLSVTSVKGLLAEPSFLLGFVLYAFSFGTWLLALSRWEVVVAFPAFAGVGYACIVLGAYFFLGESLSPTRLAGILVIFAGMLLLAR
ncbi:MAG TPA: SMR family transporter [Gaiellaceae bacterium]|nr:SMR family transporter [Gaiellaceae bacterium]